MVITDTSIDVFDKIALDIVGPLEVSQDIATSSQCKMTYQNSV